MTPGRTALIWGVLLVMLAAEVGLSFVTGAGGFVPLLGLSMAVLVALTFMRLGGSGRLAHVFALTGVFWLCVMLGLGSLDSFTRHDVPVSPASGQPRQRP